MDNIENILKEAIKKRIDNQIDEIIENKTKEFYNELVDKKDNYISEIMSGIRFLHEQNPMDLSMNYKIIFENVVRMERK